MIIVQTYGDYPMYMTPDNQIFAKLLHLLQLKSKPVLEHNVHLTKKLTAEYKIDNRTVYDIFDQICKDTNLCPYVKQHKSNTDGYGAFFAIHSRWLCPNCVNATASEVEAVLHMST